MRTTYLDIVNLETYTAAVAGRAGVRVVWDDPTGIPRTDGKTIWIPKLTSTATADDLARVRYLIKHETSHIEHTPFKFYEEVNPQGLLQFIANVLEDHRIDHKNDEMYIGDRIISEEYTEIFAREVIANMAGPDKELSEQQRLIGPLLVWDGNIRKHPVNWSVISDSILKQLTNSVDIDRVNALNAGNYGQRMIAMREAEEHNPAELMQLAEDILREVYKQDPEKYKQKPKKAGEKGEGKPKKGKSEESEDQDGKAPAPDGDDDEIITVDKLEKASHLSPRNKGIHLEHTVPTAGARPYLIPTKDEYHVIRWPITDGYGVIGQRGRDGRLHDELIDSCIKDYAKPLANKLRIKLQVQAQGRWEYGRKSGHMNSGSLHRLVTSKGTANESRVFKKHMVSDTLDTAVCVLTDCSGSMSGNKYNMAVATSLTVNEALSPLHIHHQLLGFTNNHSLAEANENPVIFVFKDWNARVAPSELRDRMRQAESALADNSDGDAIAWAAASLRQQKEHRKILIVLSDGSPSGRHFAGDISRYTKDVVQAIEKRKDIEIYGVGIMDKNVSMYYTKHSVINKAEDLPSAILDILDKSI